MICLNCFHENTTKVTNSRTKKKQPVVWRRRQCTHCGKTFTTYEKPTLADNVTVLRENGNKSAFNLGILIISIAKSFNHAPAEGEKQALWLAETVQDALLGLKRPSLRPQDILTATHAVLGHFDELAAFQYAAQHSLISSVRRRGRPSLVLHEPQN